LSTVLLFLPGVTVAASITVKSSASLAAISLFC
jgi:hypothetical protein